jgi:hypothetical protein
VAAVQRAGLDRADVPGDRERVGADEQVPVGVEAVHGVAGADADDAVVGVDAHDRRVEHGAGLGVPGGAQRRVEREAHPVQRDVGDLHRSRGRVGGWSRLGMRSGAAAPRAG